MNAISDFLSRWDTSHKLLRANVGLKRSELEMEDQEIHQGEMTKHQMSST